jgi:hypothetical protein
VPRSCVVALPRVCRRSLLLLVATRILARSAAVLLLFLVAPVPRRVVVPALFPWPSLAVRVFPALVLNPKIGVSTKAQNNHPYSPEAVPDYDG